LSIAAGLLLALGSAVALNWGWVAQHSAASELPPLTPRRPIASLRLLFRDLRWLTGFLVGIGGWALYIGALAIAPLSLVQAVAAGGIGVLALFAYRAGAPLSRSDRIAVAVSTGGLLLLAVSLAGGISTGQQAPGSAIAWWLVASLAVACLGVLGGASLAPGAGLGLAAGVLYAAGDVATKGVFGGGVWLVLIVVILAAHGGAFAALQLGFQRGRALATAGTSTLLTNALPIVGGLVVFHEQLPGGPYAVLRVVSFAAVVVGAALLALENHDPVGVAVQHAAGREGGPAEADGNVDLTRALLATRTRVRAERLDPDLQVPQCLHVPHAAVDHEAGPAACEREPHDVVADERAAQ
jgi:hypothetical protein